MQIETDPLKDLLKYGSIEPIDMELLEQAEWINFDREVWKTKQEAIDLDIIKACNTMIWFNPYLYAPSEREKPYIVGTIDHYLRGR